MAAFALVAGVLVFGIVTGTRALLSTHALSYAIEKGLHTFMEKPITVDGPTTRRMLALGEEAKKKNLKVGVGLMCRHCEARQELFNRIKDGEIGDTKTESAQRHIPLMPLVADELRAWKKVCPTASML